MSRKKVKRAGGLKEHPVGISVWGDTKKQRLEALLEHRKSNLRRAIEKGYPGEAITRYMREVDEAETALEELQAQNLERKEERKQEKKQRTHDKMHRELLKLKDKLEHRSVH